MKYRFTLLFLSLFSVAGFSQANYEPHQNTQATLLAKDAIVYDPSVTQLSQELVNQQNRKAEQYWKNILASEKTNADYWMHYYKSIRFRAQTSNQENGFRSRLDSVDTEMGKFVPGTWQQLYVHYWNGYHDLSRTSSLEKAYQLEPHDPDLLRQLIGNKLISGDKQKAGQYTSEWQATGQVSYGYFNYAFNVLQSVAQNCVLITNGEFDTYPLLGQQRLNVRTDVGILNMSLSKKSTNRSKIFKNLGLVLPENDSVSDFDAEYIRRIAAANPTKKIYLASTVSGKLLTDLQNELYITGLAFRFSTEKPVDNLIFLRDNVGTKMNEMYYAITSYDSQQLYRLKMNYVLPLAIAARQYELAGNKKKAESLRTAARRIGTANGKTDEVDTIISNQ